MRDLHTPVSRAPAAPAPRSRRSSRGLTLVELLVAVALGMFILLAIIVLYSNVSRSNNEMAKTNQLIENARFAMQILSDDVEHAGYWGPLDELVPTAVPDPCLAYVSWPTGAARDAYVVNMLGVPVQGYSDGTPYSTCGGALATVSAKSDVLIVRHASTCVVGASCEGVGDTGPHIQVSGCRTDLTQPAYVLESTTEMNARSPRIRAKGCTAEVERRRMVSNIYFVANSAAGVPTLMRMSYANGAWGAAQAVVEGIEAFKVEYGIDNLGSNGLSIAGTAPDWTNPPDGNADTYQSCTAATPCTLAVLSRAVSVRITILSRNVEQTPGYTDDKAYQVGPLAVPAANDSYKRHLFTTTVRLVNPSSRRES